MGVVQKAFLHCFRHLNETAIRYGETQFVLTHIRTDRRVKQPQEAPAATSAILCHCQRNNGTASRTEHRHNGIVKYDTGYTANVTVNEGAVWNLTGDATVTKLVNNGTINKNGYTLTYSSLSGSGTINETTGIKQIVNSKSSNSKTLYTLDGRRATNTTKGIIIQGGKKIVR